VEFVEKGSIGAPIYYNLYEFALIVNYDRLKNCIVEKYCCSMNLARFAMRHHHHEMLNKMKPLVTQNSDKLSDDDMFELYEYVVNNMPGKTDMFKDVMLKCITKKMVQLALEHNDNHILSRIVTVIEGIRTQSDRIEFLKGLDVSVINCGKDSIGLVILWIKANETDKTKALDVLMKMNMNGVYGKTVLEILYLFNDDRESLMKLLNAFWNRL
jgi:hypothetical protein